MLTTYVVTLKGTDFSLNDAVVYLNLFINKAWIEAPTGEFEMRHSNDSSMVTDGVDGRYMKSLGDLLIREFPDLRKYITMTTKGFESHGLDIHIVGYEFDIGYVRIARVVEI